MYGAFKDGTSSSANIVLNKRINTSLTSEYINLTQFQDMEDNEVYEQLLIWEPEIGGAIDRISTMVSQSVKGCIIKAGKTLDENEKELLICANEVADEMDIKTQFETIAEMLYTFGNCYLVLNKDGLSYTILPPQYVTFVEKMEDINNVDATRILTSPNILVLNERNLTNGFKRTTYTKDEFIHIKYKNTPIMCRDMMGRKTYGIYAASPLHRAVMPVWRKRQITIMDLMWRAANIPKAHHKLNSSVFSLDKYDATTWAGKRALAKADADVTMATYTKQIAGQAPDQGYVTLDTIDIEQVGGNANYMQTNELLTQIEDNIWTALNIPPSTVNGKGSGSFASELVISNYISGKVVQLSLKIKPFVLSVLKARVETLHPNLPVEKLDIKIELSMAASEMESFREISLMAQAGLFTQDEIRKRAGYEPLPDDAVAFVTPKSNSGSTLNDKAAHEKNSDGEQYPDTPMSDAQHTRDPSEEILRKDIK